MGAYYLHCIDVKRDNRNQYINWEREHCAYFFWVLRGLTLGQLVG